MNKLLNLEENSIIMYIGSDCDRYSAYNLYQVLLSDDCPTVTDNLGNVDYDFWRNSNLWEVM